MPGPSPETEQDRTQMTQTSSRGEIKISYPAGNRLRAAGLLGGTATHRQGDEH